MHNYGHFLRPGIDFVLFRTSFPAMKRSGGRDGRLDFRVTFWGREVELFGLATVGAGGVGVTF